MGDRDGWTGWLTHVVHGLPVVVIGAESREAYLRRMVPTYGAWQAARRSLPPEARALDSPRRLGVTHVLIDKRFLEANGYGPGVTWDSYALTNARTVATRYATVYEDGRAVLYRIR